MSRQNIKCQSCGRSYDYLESESCPYCGAFNYAGDDRGHTCDGDDIESIVELEGDSHDGEFFREDSRPAGEMYAGDGENLWEKYAAAKGRDTGRTRSSTPRGERSYAGSALPRPPKKARRGCSVKAVVIGVVLISIAVNVAAFLGSLLFDADFGGSAPEPDTPAGELAWAPDETAYFDAEPGQPYRVGDVTFCLEDVVLIETLRQDEGIAVVGVKMWAEADTETDRSGYSTVDLNPLLVTVTPDETGSTTTYGELDMLDDGLATVVDSYFGDYYLDFLQNYEVSYMNAGSRSAGYLPFVVHTEALNDLEFRLEVQYQDEELGIPLTVCYTLPIRDLSRTATLDEVRAAYQSYDPIY